MLINRSSLAEIVNYERGKTCTAKASNTFNSNKQLSNKISNSSLQWRLLKRQVPVLFLENMVRYWDFSYYFESLGLENFALENKSRSLSQKYWYRKSFGKKSQSGSPKCWSKKSLNIGLDEKSGLVTQWASSVFCYI